MGKTKNGICALCNAAITIETIGSHFESCHAGNAVISSKTNFGGKIFRVLVESAEWPEYWLCIDAPSNATLKKLDDFLRRIWLECCGHMSCFEISGENYYSDSESKEELGGEGMDFPIGQLLSKGKKFFYEYDFGSTTYLILRVLSERQEMAGAKKIKLLARNVVPLLKCEFCGMPATQICGVCERESGITCDNCA